MRSILSADARPALDALASTRALLVFDFDGTLAPIVPDRNGAEMRPDTRTLLRAAAVLYPCAVVSGRARSDVARRLGGIPLVAIVGNHGAEAGHGPVDRTRRCIVLGWKAALAEALRGDDGVDIEDKQFSLAVHYRHAPRRAAARRAVSAAMSALEGARVFEGRAVVNAVPLDAPDKADAVDELSRRVGARHVLYAGDDATDEVVFRKGAIDVAVRVGRTVRSSAGYYVPDQGSVDDLLRALLVARAHRDGLGERWEGLARAVTG